MLCCVAAQLLAFPCNATATHTLAQKSPSRVKCAESSAKQESSSCLLAIFATTQLVTAVSKVPLFRHPGKVATILAFSQIQHVKLLAPQGCLEACRCLKQCNWQSVLSVLVSCRPFPRAVNLAGGRSGAVLAVNA